MFKPYYNLNFTKVYKIQVKHAVLEYEMELVADKAAVLSHAGILPNCFTS